MLDLLMNRRSVRKFKYDNVEKSKIDIIIQAALTSPTGRNLKPWEIIVVEDRDKLDQLGKARGNASKFIGSAPLAFVIISDKNDSTTWLSDTSIIAFNIQLISESLGLSSCWAHVHERTAEDGSDVESNVRNILNIPDNYTVTCMLAVGYADQEKISHNKNDLKYDKIHYEEFK